MDFSGKFLPTAGEVGLLPMVTWFFLVVTFYAFAGNAIFALTARTSVAPEHRTSLIFTSIIAVVAGISYYLIQEYYRDMLHELAKMSTVEGRLQTIRQSYNAIGQLRYMDWAITTPLLLLKMILMLKIQPHQAKKAIATLLLADFFMIVTGYIGEQQLTSTGEILDGPKLVWGAISTVGYLIIPVVLLQLWRRFREQVQPVEQRAFRWMALTTVTTWGVYPIGYILTIFDGIDFNWFHIAFSVADVVNKVGVATVAYMAAKQVAEQRVPEEATMPYHQLG
jgi:bacteriorhodopsin